MTYFTRHDHLAMLSAEAGSLEAEGTLQRVYQQLVRLHKGIYPRLRKSGIELHANNNQGMLVSGHSAASTYPVQAMTLAYLRPQAKAHVVEGIMGRDQTAPIEAHRHPVIELRLTSDGFVIELVVSPYAWCDQQNLIGKMTLDQHRNSLYSLLASFDADYTLGFWGGLHLDDMHLTTEQLPPPRVLYEWLATFAAERDWLRVGVWYGIEDERLDADHIHSEVYDRIRDLYRLYDFIAWTSNNNFHSFYKRSLVSVRS